MESYSYNSSYPDSGHSSPRSREIDFENPPPWEDNSSSSSSLNSAVNKVKFMCSYGGKIHPRPHDNQLAYIGGETKILSVDRNIKFSSLISKLSALSSDADVSFKYQLPGEDLDALISVTNDDDLEHMIHEYDRQSRASAKPARMRLFLFPANPSPPASFGSDGGKSDGFVDAFNSVPVQPNPKLSAAAAAAAGQSNVDFLFGLQKGVVAAPPPVIPVPAVKPRDFPADVNLGSGTREDRIVGSDPVSVQAQLQRMQIREQKMMPPPQSQQPQQHNLVAVGGYAVDPGQKMPAMTMAPPRTEAGNWVEKHVGAGGAGGGGGGLGYDQDVEVSNYEDPNLYNRQLRAPNSADLASYTIIPPQQQQNVYMQPANFNGQPGQGYYVQRMGGGGGGGGGVPEIYREQQQPVYNMLPMSQPQHHAPPPMTTAAGGGVQQMTMVSSGVTVTADGGARYHQVQQPAGTMAYDSQIGRQVYYPAPGGMGHHHPQQMVGPPPPGVALQGMVFSGGDMRSAAAVAVPSEAAAKMVSKVPQTSV
ncbi:hypothetical protein LINGRAHAP2_LOCUS13486 [Linum grandiflorum]